MWEKKQKESFEKGQSGNASNNWMNKMQAQLKQSHHDTSAEAS